jgi:hypothetical protein
MYMLFIINRTEKRVGLFGGKSLPSGSSHKMAKENILVIKILLLRKIGCLSEEYCAKISRDLLAKESPNKRPPHDPLSFPFPPPVPRLPFIPLFSPLSEPHPLLPFPFSMSLSPSPHSLCPSLFSKYLLPPSIRALILASYAGLQTDGERRGPF